MYRTAIAQRRVKSLPIMKDLDEFENCLTRRAARRKVRQIGQFSPQGAEEALDHRIVIRVCFAAHADLHVRARQ